MVTATTSAEDQIVAAERRDLAHTAFDIDGTLGNAGNRYLTGGKRRQMHLLELVDVSAERTPQ